VSGQPLLGHSGLVKTIAFSPDGSILASGGFDSDIILWDVATQQSIGQPLARHTGGVFSLAFRPDGSLASGSVDNTIILWDLDPQAWVTATCQMVGRNFTQNEWEQYFNDQPYPLEKSTCPQWAAGGR
jgi:WD40 repeat protein